MVTLVTGQRGFFRYFAQSDAARADFWFNTIPSGTQNMSGRKVSQSTKTIQKHIGKNESEYIYIYIDTKYTIDRIYIT